MTLGMQQMEATREIYLGFVALIPFTEDGIRTGGCEGRIQARDLAEIVAQRLT